MTGRPRKKDIRQIMKWLMEIELKQCVSLITKMMVDNGVALNDIITDLHDEGEALVLIIFQPQV